MNITNIDTGGVSSSIINFCELEGIFFIPLVVDINKSYHSFFHFNVKEIKSCKTTISSDIDINNVLVLYPDYQDDCSSRLTCSDPFNPNNIVLIKGYFLSVKDKLNIFNVFILLSIDRTTETRSEDTTSLFDFSCSSVKRKFSVSGLITMISSVFTIKMGISFFVEIIDYSNDKMVILFNNSAVYLHPYLQCGDSIEIINIKKFRWKPISQDGAVSDNETLISYFVDSHNNITKHVSYNKNPIDFIHINKLFSVYKCLLSPSPLEVDHLSRSEMDIICTVLRIDRNGWLEVQICSNNNNNSNHQDVILGIYFPHNNCQDFRFVFKSCELSLYKVSPVFLWSKLKGFAFTSRSKLVVCKFPLLSSQTAAVVNIPLEIRQGCHLYTAFRMDLSRKLQAVVLNWNKLSRTLETSVILAVESRTQDRVRNVLRVPEGSRAIQEEFVDPWLTQLQCVRAGLDLDWVCSRLLPQVVGVGFLKTKLKLTLCRGAELTLGRMCKFRLLDSSLSSDFNAVDTRKNICLVASLSELDWSGHKPLSFLMCKLVDSQMQMVDLVVKDLDEELRRQVLELLTTHQHLGILDKCGQTDLVRFRFPIGSQPVVVVHCPNYLVEEGGGGSGSDNRVVVCSCSSTVVRVLVDTSSSSGPMNGVGGNPEMANGTKVIEPSKVVNVCSIRDLLMKSFGTNIRELPIPLTEGVVLSKQILVDDFKNDNNSFANKKRKAGHSSDKKCCLVLRDSRFPDFISLYLPLTMVDRIWVGMLVQVSNCMLCVPETKRKLYLKKDDSRGTRLSVTGLADQIQLAKICGYTLKPSDPRRLDSGEHLQNPPHTTVRQLSKVCYNRCLWTVSGQMVFLRKVSASVRCSGCLSSLKVGMGYYYCYRCSRSNCHQILWEATIALDDGTGECNVTMEGDNNIFSLLNSKFDEGGEALRNIQTKLQELVLSEGRFQYDANEEFSKTNAPEELDDDAILLELLENIHTVEFGSTKSFIEHICDPKLDGRAAFLTYVKTLQYCRYFEIVCKINYFALLDNNNNNGNKKELSMKLKLQEINHDRPYMVSFTNMPSLRSKKLSLEGFSISVLEGNSMRIKAWNDLNNL